MTHLSPIENLFAVEVPGDAKDFVIDMGYLIFKIMDMDPKKWVTDKEIEQDVRRFLRTGKSRFDNMKEESMWLTTGIPVPPGSYEILCTTKPNNEEEAEKIVSWFELEGEKGYRDYLWGRELRYPFKHASSSLLSLLRANGLNPENKNYLLIKKPPQQ